MNKKIIFACTSGIATSAVATEKVVQFCKTQGLTLSQYSRILAQLVNRMAWPI